MPNHPIHSQKDLTQLFLQYCPICWKGSSKRHPRQPTLSCKYSILVRRHLPSGAGLSQCCKKNRTCNVQWSPLLPNQANRNCPRISANISIPCEYSYLFPAKAGLEKQTCGIFHQRRREGRLKLLVRIADLTTTVGGSSPKQILQEDDHS